MPNLLNLIQEEKVSDFWYNYNAKLDVSGRRFDNYDLSSLRCVQYGGGPMPTRVIEEVLQKLPGGISRVMVKPREQL